MKYSKVENYYQNEAIKLAEFENALKTELLDREIFDEIRCEANYWARVDAAEFERENETYNWNLN